MLLPPRFCQYYLIDFDELGGRWDTIEVSKRTSKYTDRLCKLSLDGIEEYTHIRFYKNGLAMIGDPFIDIDTGKTITRTDPEIMAYMNSILFNIDNRHNLSPYTEKRHNQETVYEITTVLVWILIAVLTILTLFRVLSILECGIGITLLTIHLIAKRKIWREKIQLIGSKEKDYYSRYK